LLPRLRETSIRSVHCRESKKQSGTVEAFHAIEKERNKAQNHGLAKLWQYSEEHCLMNLTFPKIIG